MTQTGSSCTASDTSYDTEASQDLKRTPRCATIRRHTQETQIQATLDLNDPSYHIETHIPFFDHMLEQLCRHSGIGMTLKAQGDTEIDDHHTVEDTGIVLGQVLEQALGDKRGIARFGHAYVPLDEALSRCVIDLSGRPGLWYRVEPPRAWVGRFDVDLVPEFFTAFCNHARCTLHLESLYGQNTHHIIESLFKSFARALKMAVAPTQSLELPSTKGLL